MKKIICLILIMSFVASSAYAINAMGSAKTRASITHPKKR